MLILQVFGLLRQIYRLLWVTADKARLNTLHGDHMVLFYQHLLLLIRLELGGTSGVVLLAGMHLALLLELFELF